MKGLYLLFAMGLVFGLAASANAQHCTSGEYFKSIREFPNGSVQIEEPGIYAAGVLVDYFSYASDNTMLCDLLGYPKAFGAQLMEVEDKSTSCILVDSRGNMSTTSDCGSRFKYLFCKKN